MISTVVHGAVLAVVAVLIAVVGPSIGITELWPFLLAAGVAIAPGGSALGRSASFAVGALIGWGVFALRAGVLPAGTTTEVLLALAGVALVTLVALVSFGRMPLWAGLAGGAAFLGLYTPVNAANPTLFLSESPLSLGAVLVAAGIAALVGTALEVVGGAAEPVRRDGIDRVELRDGEVA